MQLWIALGAAFVLVLFVLLQRGRQQQKAEAQSARYAALQNQQTYTAAAFPCTVKFPSGFAHRVTAYDPFVFRGYKAELASCSDAVDGEVWAEFYSLNSSDEAAALMKAFAADETHRLVRQRLTHLFDYSMPSEVDQLQGKFQVLSEGERDGWKIRLAYLPTPHGAGPVRPLQVPRSELRREDIVAELPLFGIPSNNLSPWIWVGIDDFRNQSERDAFRRAERQALEKLKDQQLEYRKARERFERMHRHFYVVEAAKTVGPEQVIVLRRFGSIVDPKTPQSASTMLGEMISSLRCP